MLSEQILENLANLRTSLQRLEPAIAHVETAQKATALVEKITTQHAKLIEAVQGQEKLFKQDLLNIHERWLADSSTKMRASNKAYADLLKSHTDLIEKTGDISKTLSREVAALTQVITELLVLELPSRLYKIEDTSNHLRKGSETMSTRLADVNQRFDSTDVELAAIVAQVRQAATSLQELKETTNAIQSTLRKQITVLTVIAVMGLIAGVVGIFVK